MGSVRLWIRVCRTAWIIQQHNNQKSLLHYRSQRFFLFPLKSVHDFRKKKTKHLNIPVFIIVLLLIKESTWSCQQMLSLEMTMRVILSIWRVGGRFTVILTISAVHGDSFRLIRHLLRYQWIPLTILKKVLYQFFNV